MGKKEVRRMERRIGALEAQVAEMRSSLVMAGAVMTMGQLSRPDDRLTAAR